MKTLAVKFARKITDSNVPLTERAHLIRVLRLGDQTFFRMVERLVTVFASLPTRTFTVHMR